VTSLDEDATSLVGDVIVLDWGVTCQVPDEFAFEPEASTAAVSATSGSITGEVSAGTDAMTPIRF
jgi:hypothetical protein